MIKTKVSGLIRPIRKEYKDVCAQKREFVQPDSLKQQRDAVLKFLDNPRLISLVKFYLGKDTLTEEEKLRVRRLLVCTLLLKNAQRESTATSMTLQELRQARDQPAISTGARMTIIKVWNHKTSSTFGSARLVVTTEVANMVKEYVEKVRPALELGAEKWNCPPL